MYELQMYTRAIIREPTSSATLEGKHLHEYERTCCPARTVKGYHKKLQTTKYIPLITEPAFKRHHIYVCTVP